MRRGTWMALAIIGGLWSAMASTFTSWAQEPVEEASILPGGGPPPAASPPHASHRGWGRGIETYVPDATGRPNTSTYVTTQGGVHLHQPQHPKPPCQRPTSICIKPKMWTFSQVFYQLHHEVWHGVTDPCWLMDPDCCGNSCQHQKSFGLLRLFPWAERAGGDGSSRCQQCSGTGGQPPVVGGCNHCGASDMPGADKVEGEEVEEGEEVVPTPAEPPVEHPKAAQRGPIHSVLLKRE